MIKLYKTIDNQLCYAESWVDDDIATVHTGVVGTVGECYEEDCRDEEKYLKEFRQMYEKQGYAEIPDNKMCWVNVRWQVNDFKLDEAETQALNLAYDSLNEALGWTGLGFVDGFEVEKQDDKFFVILFSLCVDEKLGKQIAGNSTELECEFEVYTEKFE